MFKWLARQFNADTGDADSLGSDKGLEAFVAALPVTVPARTVDAIGEPFENARALELEPEKLRRALKRLDERAQEPLAAVWLDLFDDERGRVFRESAWLALARFHRNVHTGYRVCLDALPDRTEQTDEERSDATLIACRAMASLGRYKSLLRMRYRVIEPAYWEHLHGLAMWSASFGSSNTLIELYDGSGHQSSVEREYLIALLYEVAPIANMLPPQLAALDLLLRRFAGHYHFADAYRESAPFVVDPVREHVPRRWLKGLTSRPDLRFFGIAGAYAQLAGARKLASRSVEVPEWLAPARLGLESYRHLLDLLLTHWSVQPPQRRHRRDRLDGEMMVTHGVAQVRRMIAASEYAKSGGQLNYEDNTPYDHKLFGRLRFGSVREGAAAATEEPLVSPLETLQKFELEGDRQMTERWLAADVSDQGLGAIAPAHGGWARIGMLLGLRRLDSLDWQIATVRRLNRSPQGKLSVGMETIGSSTFCARLRFGSGDAGNTWVAVAGTTDAYHDAILLRGSGPTSLLLDVGIFSGPGECMLSFDKRWHQVRLVRSIESGYDYERIEVAIDPE